MAKNALHTQNHIKRSLGDHLFNAANITLFVRRGYPKLSA